MRSFGSGGRDVHLWLVRLEASEADYERSRTLLSPDEIARVERFYFDRHRHAFAVGRAALRLLLASYLDMQATDVRFTYGDQGKPALADLSCSLRFNVSNSGNLAAYVFAQDCELGVDIEQHRSVHDFEHIAHRFFSPEEAAELLNLAPAERPTAFFNCWSRKEAYIKAMGGGLSIPLDSFRVTLRPDDAAGMVSIDGSEEFARAWTLHAFTPGPECAGAVAYRDHPRRLRTGPIASIEEMFSWSTAATMPAVE